MSDALYYTSGGLALVSAVLLVAGVLAFRRRHWMSSLGSTGTGALCLSTAALFATLGVSTQGYRALTQEVTAATVTTVPTGPGSFQAFVEFPDGRTETFNVAGDQLLVDAHILKWHPIANILGIHTHYELDRLGGRYTSIEDERSLPRTVHSLKTEKPADLFDLARRHTLLAFLVDTEYGSATYIDVRRPGRFEVRVSTSGLLMRPTDFERREDETGGVPR